MKKKLIIFGLGDFARLAAFYFERETSFEVVGFTANRAYIEKLEWLGKPVLAFEDIEGSYPPNSYFMFVAIGFKEINRARARLYEACKAKGYQLASYVDSTVANLGGATIGDNCFILENVILQPFARIGNDVVIWAGSHVGHDSTIEDHVFLAPAVAISGNVKVEAFSFIGINATVRDGVTIANGCVVGAGVTVLKDTIPGAVYGNEMVAPRKIDKAKLKGF